MPIITKPKTILFDLDGTLLDTAPDLANALNTVLAANQRPILPLAQIRPVASHGGKGLIKLGFGIDETHSEYSELRQELLRCYQQNLCDETKLFPGMEHVLNHLNDTNTPWGVVTNKPSWLTEPLVANFAFFQQAGCIVSGDTVAKSKPHPEPLWHACSLLNCTANQSLYIGDAERDIQAAKSAGMPAIVALYGYIAEQDAPHEWGADAFIYEAKELLAFLPSLSSKNCF